ncbi:MAG: hypothetical protein H7A25_00925 [Leptospiraceae bacterium]|nr:hypothetical protein [Leptospiraceae bacterium]MCP5498438.1 hypothetical protein [Leptospiraceae bacterium]
MKENGPELEYLLNRLANCPAEFFLEPGLGKETEVLGPKQINTLALISDLFYNMGGYLLSDNAADVYRKNYEESKKNFFLILHVAAYFFSDPFFLSEKRFLGPVEKFFNPGSTNELHKLAKLIEAEKFVTDPERREEFVRLCLAQLNLKPGGETEVQAKDRLNTLDSVERERVIRETQKAIKRAKEIQEAQRRKEAEEAASKMPRE